MLAFFAILVPAAFWPGVPEATVTAKWAVISAVPVLLFWLRPRWSVVHSVALSFIGWSALSVWWAPTTPDAIDAVLKLILGFVVFLVGFETENLGRFYKFLAIGLVPSSLVAICQSLGLVTIEWGVSPTGLFGNPNVMAELAALVVLGLAFQGSYGLAALSILPVLLTQARGAVLALILSAVVGRRFSLSILLIAMAALIVIPAKSDLHSLRERTSIWSDSMAVMTPVGHGIGSFQTVLQDRSNTTHRVVQHAHNDAIELGVELGIPGLFLALALVWLVMARAEVSDRLVLGALGIEAMFGFPLHMPATVFVGAIVAGHAARGWAGVRVGELVRGQALQHRNA